MSELTVEPRRYGPGPDQIAELRRPTGAGPHPVAIVIHGGFWRSVYGLEIMARFATALTEEGWATWNIEYRRVGTGGGVPQTLDDVAAACAAVRELDAPLDLDNVVAVGHSAGGHLALWAAGEGAVTGACSLAGVCDLTAGVERNLGSGAVVAFAGASPTEAPKSYDRADPLRRLPTGVATLLVHGTEDAIVPVELSRSYERAARAAGDECRLIEFAGDHFDVIDPGSAVWPRIVDGLARLRTAG
jgi:acetyl esterase/lipase